MVQRTLVIAEPGMTWDRNLDKAYRLIEAAKECDADVIKFQWTSNGRKIQERRQVDPKYAAIYERGVQYPREWLEKLKARCGSVGIEFMCTTYLIEDIAVIHPLVKRMKVSAYESQWSEFVEAHPACCELIVSLNPGTFESRRRPAKYLHCVSKYPTRLEDLTLQRLIQPYINGLSDHSANVLTGAIAVAKGASIIESHICLFNTPKDNPDYAHSLPCDLPNQPFPDYQTYVRNIRTAEKMV